MVSKEDMKRDNMFSEAVERLELMKVAECDLQNLSGREITKVYVNHEAHSVRRDEIADEEMQLIRKLEAEKNIATGAERKKWVVSMVIASAANINYPLTNEDIQKLEDLVDAICDASKVINNPVASNKVLEESQDKTEKTETSK